MTSRKTLVLSWCLLAAVIPSAAMAAGAGVRGTVSDSSGTPLAKVTITLRGVDADFEKVVTTNKKGKFDISVSDAELEYVVRVEKEGYYTQEEPLPLKPGQAMEVTWRLHTLAEAAEQTEQIQALQARDKATKAYNAGAEAYNAKDVEGAIGHFREATEANPGLEIAHVALGRVLLEEKRWPEAQAAAEAFMAAYPEQPQALLSLYDAYWGQGQKEKAEETLNRLLAVEPGPAIAARIFNQGVAATKVLDYDTAFQSFSHALELDSDLYQAHLPLAQIHYSRGEWQAAIDEAEKYLGKDAKNARANIVRYKSYQELKNTEAADRAFVDLETNSPLAAAELFLRDGIDLFNDGDNPGALEAVEASIRLDPGNARAQHQLGLCYASAGNNAKARTAFEKFLELAPDDPEAASVKDMLAYLKLGS